MCSTRPPVLSICIPAYGFEEGVRRILKRFNGDPRLEILISEDFSDRPLDLSDCEGLIHKVNAEPGGAVANWNRVMSWATGDYVWLLHHDEEPFFFDGLESFLCRLQEPSAPCLLVSRLELRDRFWQRVLRSDAVRRTVLHWPSMVLLHNSIGAPSNVIIRRKNAELFDERLKWFVDLEWYYRLFTTCRHVAFSQFGILTHSYDGSITRNMQEELAVLATREVAFVCEKHGIKIGFRKLWHWKLRMFQAIKRNFCP